MSERDTMRDTPESKGSDATTSDVASPNESNRESPPDASPSDVKNFDPYKFQANTMPPGLRAELIAAGLPRVDPGRIEESRANAKAAGVESLVEFRVGDVLQADVSPATVVTLYLLTSSNLKLRPILERQLRPGARIVSHAFSMGPEWPADLVDRFTSERGDEVTLYLWRVR